MAKILVVDDDAFTIMLVRQVLQQKEHEVIGAADGIEGMQKFASEAPDLLVVDLIMPKQDGITTIRQLRESSCGVPIIALSGGSPVVVEADWTDSFQLATLNGADATLKKPVLPSELVATVERLLAG